jgi:hypothetical protein
LKRAFFTAVMLGTWAFALALALGVGVYEFASGDRKALYEDLLKANPDQIRAAHVLWYNEAALLGAVLIVTSVAYLMYVKWLQTVPDQERIISGIKN